MERAGNVLWYEAGCKQGMRVRKWAQCEQHASRSWPCTASRDKSPQRLMSRALFSIALIPTPPETRYCHDHRIIAAVLLQHV